MQAITIAIGPVGVAYFGQTLLAADIVGALGRLAPPNRTIPAPDFRETGFGYSNDYSKIRIELSNGGFSGFTPQYGGLSQRAGGKFQVALSAANFGVNYNWNESYHEHPCSYGRGGHCTDDDKSAGPFTYPPHFGGLAVQLQLAFTYDQPSNSYEVTVAGVTAAPSGVTPNVPAGSVIQKEDQQCFASHVSDATAGAVASIDFGTPIAALFGRLLKSIPASGHVTADIAYEFAVGDSGLTFPGDQGLAVGVTGAVTYKGERFPGKPPPPLPVPPVPTDANHLRAYVSSYEFDALNWAFFKAGLLNYTLNPDDLPDPDVLKVKTYVTYDSAAFKPYASFAMQAQITAKQAPTTSFEPVWELSKGVMAALQQKLPASIYPKLSGLDGNNYVAQADLDDDVKGAGVTDPSYLAIIEQTARTMGMVVHHDLEFKLMIQNGDPAPPNVVFDVVRTDILQNLSLGVSGGAQTLKFDFVHVDHDAKFVSTTIPKLTARDFGAFIWPGVGERTYVDELQKIGRNTGVPLPIMQGFHFLLDNALLSIQDGYVSVLAQVQFTKPAAPSG